MFKMADEGRREEAIFFIYDHNMLKKEEDDLIEAILYFSPENVSADDQCALCGQLMGMGEFLSATLGQSCPKIFKFEHEKFAIKRVGGYSLGLQCKRNDPDSVVTKQLDYLYETFVTFHGSLNSLRLRCKDNNNNFTQDLGNIWRTILSISGVSLQLSIDKTFHHLPYIQLPKTGSHLYLQASHLLQSSQRRPYVLGGAILYKNEVVCTQLPPMLTRQLTYLQAQMPYIEKKMDFELPVGCKICTLFLTDDELNHIFTLDPYARRHCKISDFSSRRESDVPFGMTTQSSQVKLSTRRQTCPNISSSLTMYDNHENISKVSDQSKPLLEKDGKISFKKSSNFIGVEGRTWGRTRSKMSLSHVPIVECRSGESPIDSEAETLIDAADESYFGKSYRSSHMNEPYSLESLKADMNATDNDSDDDFDLSDAEKYLCEDTSKSLLVEMSSEEADLRTNVNDSNYVKSKSSKNNDTDVIETKVPCEKIVGEPSSDSVPNNRNPNKFSTDMAINSEKGSKFTERNGNNNCDLKTSDPKLNINEKDLCSKFRVRAEINAPKDQTKENSLINDNVMEVGETREATEISENECERNITHTTEDNNIVEHVDRTIVEYSTGHKSDTVESSADETENSSQDRIPSETVNKIESSFGEKQNSNGKDNIVPDEGVDTMKEGLSPENICNNFTSILTTNETKSKTTWTVSESLVCTSDETEVDDPCINCLELRSENPQSSQARCSQCLSKRKSQIINHFDDRKEVIDFSVREDQGSITDHVIDPSDTEISHSVISNDTLTFSSDVSTDSTISRFWTHEMDGLNDVTLYIQCHSDISLLLLMENPEQYQENLLHSLWKGSLHYLADLDFYIKECLEQKENVPVEHFSFAQFNKFSRDLKENVETVPVKKKAPFNQILAALHAEFDYHPSLTNLTLRNQGNSCYGHRNEVNETFFQLEGPTRLTSGLPLSKDPNYVLDSVARTVLSKDRHISFM